MPLDGTLFGLDWAPGLGWMELGLFAVCCFILPTAFAMLDWHGLSVSLDQYLTRMNANEIATNTFGLGDNSIVHSKRETVRLSTTIYSLKRGTKPLTLLQISIQWDSQRLLHASILQSALCMNDLAGPVNANIPFTALFTENLLGQCIHHPHPPLNIYTQIISPALPILPPQMPRDIARRLPGASQLYTSSHDGTSITFIPGDQWRNMDGAWNLSSRDASVAPLLTRACRPTLGRLGAGCVGVRDPTVSWK